MVDGEEARLRERTGFTGELAGAPAVLVSSIHGVAGTERPSREEV